ncbi:hypothetical protein DM02DRAFT_415682 [Periconia macrospinosa]|uniref:Uncharacterized protein n=1 Tax=Periconia macrospinosa TaxID=97972 RepID=A0A2V1DR79_9PLEO|nr:hypothetical protein DM02DRAFT_415682 [Periconia macrospinosa]
MPPRNMKASETHEGLKRLMESYSISFEGPVPPNRWPSLYSHHFHVIRDISRVRYDEYIARTDLDVSLKVRQQKRVRQLREKAYSLRKDLNINEDTWRGMIEPHAVEIFEESVICYTCGDEPHIPEHLAVPHDTRTKEALDSKRRSRKKCECQGVGKSLVDHDDEIQRVFKTVIGKLVAHSDINEHDGLLRKHRVSMKPDRVIGLSITDGMRQCLDHCQWNLEHRPVDNIEMVYPFLVIEAKKGDNSPGFRSIERQTAFPIRRFLHIQDELRNRFMGNHGPRNNEVEYRCEPPLVWFFANIGEEWRLYAAVFPTRTMSAVSTGYDKEKISVYDLWHGTIESEDGALQLLQVVDYIWTWARDIFRPQIKACLRGEVQRMQSIPLPTSKIGPLPTNRFDTSYRAETPDTIMTDIMETTESVDLIAESTLALQRSPDPQQEFGRSSPISIGHEDLTRFPFLRWAKAHRSLEQFSCFSTIRHANIVLYAFRIQKILNIEKFLLGGSSTQPLGARMKLFDLLKCAISIKNQNLHQLVHFWTGKKIPTTDDNVNETKMVSIFYHTYCQRHDWQIVRQIECIIWPDDYYKQKVDSLNQEHVDRIRNQQPIAGFELTSAFIRLRVLSGRHSLYAALKEYCIFPAVLDNVIHWVPETVLEIQTKLLRSFIDILDDNLLFTGLQNQVQGFSAVREDPNHQSELLASLGELPEWQKAVIVTRSDWWPSDCPKFCLFVLSDLEEKCDRREVVVRLLREELVRHRFYGPDDCSESDKRRLREWLKWLENSNL